MAIEGKKILLVEDEELISDICKTFLERNGASVLVSQDGQNALDMMNKEKIDLVVLDRKLGPGMDGFKVLKEMRSNEKTKETPVVILTNFDLDESEKEFIEKHNLGGYFLKSDVSMEDLSTMLGKMI